MKTLISEKEISYLYPKINRIFKSKGYDFKLRKTRTTKHLYGEYYVVKISTNETLRMNVNLVDIYNIIK